ncbi:hypothetical protein TNCV_1446671 [Trichonephila clavipes]|nr:hypothetical protein TNCV_1446671 [Trichonephila clavipes]
MTGEGLISLATMKLWKDFPALFKIVESSAKVRQVPLHKVSAVAGLAKLYALSRYHSMQYGRGPIERV